MKSFCVGVKLCEEINRLYNSTKITALGKMHPADNWVSPPVYANAGLL